MEVETTPKKSTAEQLTDTIRAYYKVPIDSPNVDALLTIRRRLAVLKFGFAREVGELYTEKNGAEYRRKSAFARERQTRIEAGDSAAKAEAAAEVAVEELRKEESHADAAYRSAYLILESASDVLDTTAQHIANLRQEKRLETTGQGSQA